MFEAACPGLTVRGLVMSGRTRSASLLDRAFQRDFPGAIPRCNAHGSQLYSRLQLPWIKSRHSAGSAIKSALGNDAKSCQGGGSSRDLRKSNPCR